MSSFLTLSLCKAYTKDEVRLKDELGKSIPEKKGIKQLYTCSKHKRS